MKYALHPARIRVGSILLLVSLVVSPSLASAVVQESVVESSWHVTSSATNYTDHEPIYIDPRIFPNSSFVNQGWPGSGTPEDPYVIEGLRIVDPDDCIRIIGTEEYFVIRHCYLDSTVGSRSVLLSSVVNGVIEDCILQGGVDIFGSESCILKSNTVLDAATGVRGHDIKNCEISNNTISSCTRGVDIYDSRYTLISENLIERCVRDAVYLLDSVGIIVRNNTIADNPHGIHLANSPITEIVHNEVHDQELIGIFLDYRCGYSEILNNQIRDTTGTAVVISGSRSVKIERNEIESAQVGLSVWDSEGSTIQNNEFIECLDFGANVRASQQTVIDENLFVDNGYCSIDIDWNCRAANNTIIGGTIGIEVSVESRGSEVAYNNISGCSETGISTNYGRDHYLLNNSISDCQKSGIKVDHSTGFEIINNTMWNCGVEIDGSETQHWDHLFQNNTVNSKAFGYFRNAIDSVIDASEFSQVILYNSSEVILENGSFDELPFGVILAHSNSSKVSNCTFQANLVGVDLSYSEACIVANNTFTQCGLVLSGDIVAHWNHSIIQNLVNSKPLTILRNLRSTTIDAREFGQIVLVNCTDVVVNGGVIANASSGLQVANSTDCTVHNLTLSGNSKNGVNIVGSIGISVIESSFFDNFESILATNSERCTVRNNTVLRSLDIGIHMGSGTRRNFIYWNVIGSSGRRNAHDDGFLNQWDDGQSVGNFWDDYIGTGFYFIHTEFPDPSGRLVIIDRFPNGTAGDPIPPVIDTVEDIEFVMGTWGHSIVWNVSDTNPFDYRIFRNGSLVESQPWLSDIIVVALNSLDAGLYNFTLIITDLGMNYATDSVIVRVIRFIRQAPDPTAYLTLVLVFAASVSVVTLALIFEYRRRFTGNQS